jgi:PAS domain S-box-containing protein
VAVRILCLEDDPHGFELVRAMLAAEGIECEPERVDDEQTFAAALERGGFDLILSDYSLPAFDGFSALAMVRAKRPEIPFVFFSGTVGEELAIEAVKSGATDYVLKQRPLRLPIAVRRALREAAERAERLDAEERLRSSEARYRTLVRNFPNGAVLLFDRDLRITLVEGTAARGVDTAALEGQPLAALASPASFAVAEPHLRAALEGAARQFEVRVGDRVHAVYAVPIRDQRGDISGGMIVTQNVTERKRAEEEVSRLNRELEQRVADRTAALEAANRELEAFSYSVSHDLRAPLRAIDGFTRVLMEDHAPQLDDEGKRYLQRVGAAARRMNELIEDLLALSRVTRAELHLLAVDLSRTAQAVAAELQKAEPERAVEFVITPALEAFGDARLLRIVLENLLGNAWKYTSKQSRARIEFGELRSEETRGGHSEVRNSQSEIVFFVRDNGAGFDMQYAERLFVPFQRLHDSSEFEGTGIGLATVQRIVHRHGGRVWAEGAPGRGATFFFTLGAPGGRVGLCT